MPKIRVIELQTGNTLLESQLSESDYAYQFAGEMERIGIDVKVEMPTLSETLSLSLGLSVEQTQAFEESLAEEIEQHEDSCCFSKAGPNLKKT